MGDANGSFYPVQIYMDNGQAYKPPSGMRMRMSVSHLDDKGNDSNFYNSASAEATAQKGIYWFNALKSYVYGQIKVRFEIIDRPKVEPVEFVIKVDFDKDGRPDPRKVNSHSEELGLGENEVIDYEFQPAAEMKGKGGDKKSTVSQIPYAPYKFAKPRKPKRVASTDDDDLYAKQYATKKRTT